MKNNHFLLGSGENNRLVKIVRIIFGILCIVVAVFWLIFNFKALQADTTLWVTIIFLTVFGLYQIWSGIGLATIYIDINDDFIRLKKNPVLPPVLMKSAEIKKIELFPLNVIFILNSKNKILLRFGTTYRDTNDQIKEEIIEFASKNKIHLDFVEEEL